MSGNMSSSTRLLMRSVLLQKCTRGPLLASLYYGKYHTSTGVYGFRPRQRTENADLDQETIDQRSKYANLWRYITAYRNYGHRRADINPLGYKPHILPELDPSIYNLSHDDQYPVKGLLNVTLEDEKPTGSLSEITDALERLYCGAISVEFQHLFTQQEREWFAHRYEEIKFAPVPDEKKIELAKLMLRCQAFDRFLANKFPTVKRYGAEGCETMIGFFQELFTSAAEFDIEEVIMCMPHRGRLNLLTCLLKYPPVAMFHKMKGKREFPPDIIGEGDVLSHLSTSVDLSYGDKKVHVTMLPNPSHLEANNPVSVGKARAREQSLGDGDYSPDETSLLGDKVLCLQVHGDASFAAQGVVAETFALADVPHFSVGGSVHFVVNNQLGFTTEATRGRSSLYSSCIGKMNACPVIHVNADFPEEIIKATRLAIEYRQKFRRDVVVDLICFRRWGHNEVDDPDFTQPIMYETIKSRRSLPDLYSENVLEIDAVCNPDVILNDTQEWQEELSEQLKIDSYVPHANHLEKQWSGYVQAPSSAVSWDTGVNLDLLKFVGAKSVDHPEDMHIHPLLAKTHCARRLTQLTEGEGLDWATAEALAMGSLLYQGYNVRLSGQDVGRGTFSHRHVMLVDQKSDEMYIPLNHMTEDQRYSLEVANSILSEESVLGFEYGFSIENPRNLVIWEAQFGDFFNGAQPIIDTYITAGESKWLLQSGLVMLLPTGMDGAGPEHSSCRIERFLQQCDSKEDAADGEDVNVHIVHPTTPAQYFHLLRRQMIRNFRKPLVVASPKVLLRLPAAQSSLSEMAPGTTFLPVIGDPDVNPDDVTRVIFCSGKHFYALHKQRAAEGVKDTAIIRLESLCPFPLQELQTEMKRFPKANKFIWSQEEHQNYGPWSFVNPRFENLLGCKLNYVGRRVLGMPAVGVGQVHQQEALDVVAKPFVS